MNRYLKRQNQRLYQDRFNKEHDCHLEVCDICRKEFYTTGAKHICKECHQAKEKKKLLAEQEKLARELGLIK